MWYALHLCKYVHVCILFTRACFVYENAAPFSFAFSCTACTLHTAMEILEWHSGTDTTWAIKPYYFLSSNLYGRTYRYIVISIQYAIWLRLNTNMLRRYKINGYQRTERKTENTSNKIQVYRYKCSCYAQTCDGKSIIHIIYRCNRYSIFWIDNEAHSCAYLIKRKWMCLHCYDW